MKPSKHFARKLLPDLLGAMLNLPESDREALTAGLEAAGEAHIAMSVRKASEVDLAGQPEGFGSW